MARSQSKSGKPAKAESKSGATVGYEAQLWQMADTLRGSRRRCCPRNRLRHHDRGMQRNLVSRATPSRLHGE